MTEAMAPLVPVWVPVADPRARTLFEDLEHEYDTRYQDLSGEGAATELNRYPAHLFDPPHGAFLLILQDGEAVAGGAFMPVTTEGGEPRTAEFKRIWTHPAHRRRGLSRRVLAELEREAVHRGYGRVYLETGPRQPEADGLYASSGYTALFDPDHDRSQMILHGYEKLLVPGDDGPGSPSV